MQNYSGDDNIALGKFASPPPHPPPHIPRPPISKVLDLTSTFLKMTAH